MAGVWNDLIPLVVPFFFNEFAHIFFEGIIKYNNSQIKKLFLANCDSRGLVIRKLRAKYIILIYYDLIRIQFYLNRYNNDSNNFQLFHCLKHNNILLEKYVKFAQIYKIVMFRIHY